MEAEIVQYRLTGSHNLLQWAVGLQQRRKQFTEKVQVEA